MNMSARPRGHERHRAFTLIELLVVIVALALIAMLAAPAFTRMLAKKRIEGITSELVTDLQYARSEAIQRNTRVRVMFGSGCYVIHTEGSGALSSCAQTGPSTLGADSMELKTVQLPVGSPASFSTTGSPYLQFEPERGIAVTSGSVNVTTSSGEWQLRAIVSTIGRVRTCSPNSSVPGYSNDCS
jgi:type IV fimbrial biogenesis protein FimT